MQQDGNIKYQKQNNFILYLLHFNCLEDYYVIHMYLTADDLQDCSSSWPVASPQVGLLFRQTLRKCNVFDYPNSTGPSTNFSAQNFIGKKKDGSLVIGRIQKYSDG